MKKILLLTDFSENSINAMRYALQLYYNDFCDFIVMNIHDSMTYTTDDLMVSKPNESIYEALIKENNEKLKRIVNDLKRRSNNRLHTFYPVVDYDVFVDAIKQAILKHNIEYVVMGTNGASNLREALLGSNALKVLRTINCNTLVVPEGHSYRKLEKILLALDIDDYADHKTVVDIINLVKQLDIDIKVVRFLSSEDNLQAKINLDKELLLELLNEKKFTYDTVYGLSLSTILIDDNLSKGADMITLVGQFKGFFERLFTDPSKTKISKNLLLPLMVFHH
ncbi:universal stress protein [Winogradskyella luteola]|uniref:Universal stress protein n=1 Tax=Winogradskyella luteola TaxID=2828330 RepID=A0A9X1JPZ3_9FLAO|nr:universal stress protein [Winogradskyella luteola]MBV7268433.1 universal stress protein [Winogradskyella luteola]